VAIIKAAASSSGMTQGLKNIPIIIGHAFISTTALGAL